MLKKVKERKMISTAAGAALAFAGGFLFSGGTIAGAASFADISLVGAVNLPCAAAAYLGIRTFFSRECELPFAVSSVVGFKNQSCGVY